VSTSSFLEDEDEDNPNSQSATGIECQQMLEDYLSTESSRFPHMNTTANPRAASNSEEHRKSLAMCHGDSARLVRLVVGSLMAGLIVLMRSGDELRTFCSTDEFSRCSKE